MGVHPWWDMWNLGYAPVGGHAVTKPSSESAATPVLRLELLGGARLHRPDGVTRLERKSAALLALLSLDGPTSRARLAGLLWPDSPDSTARNNLRQLLRRMRAALGEGLVEGADALSVPAAVEVDARAAADSRADASGTGGTLLAGLEYDDLPELARWLEARRESLQGARGEAEARELTRLEREGDLPGAVALARRAVEREPLSEEAHRRLMRLLYVVGDRGAALAVFERLRALLKSELGVTPLHETVALARELAAAAQRAPAPGAGTPAARIPLTVLRPPVLAGREREWAQMEEAYAAGKGVVLGGPPGVGKTRLMQDFLNTHGRPLFFAGRPGDRAVPYGTHARTYRQMLEALGNPPMPEWVRRELARILPQLGDAPPPLRDETEKLRFFQAKTELHRMAYAAGFDGLGFDDLQYVDAASGEAGNYVLSQVRGAGADTPIFTVHCYRTGELPPDLEAIVRAAHDAGMLLHLELQPLAVEGVGALLSSLGVPGLEGLAQPLTGYTGGNPFFLLETVKHLVETGMVEAASASPALPAHLTPPGAVRPVIAGRLERLSAPALQLARVLAVLGESFTLELAGEVLDAGPVALAIWWSELEVAQVVRAQAFSHDLLEETVAATTPAPVAAMLHRRAAVALEARGASPALLALHWEEGGEPGRAAPLWRRAADSARDALLHQEAAVFTRKAQEAQRASRAG